MPSFPPCRPAPRIISLRNTRVAPVKRALAGLPPAGAAAAGNSDDARAFKSVPVLSPATPQPKEANSGRCPHLAPGRLSQSMGLRRVGAYEAAAVGRT